ncbi:MAG: hypothetical protein U0744_15630 [Gemmataceae bacterium]
MSEFVANPILVLIAILAFGISLVGIVVCSILLLVLPLRKNAGRRPSAEPAKRRRS